MIVIVIVIECRDIAFFILIPVFILSQNCNRFVDVSCVVVIQFFFLWCVSMRAFLFVYLSFFLSLFFSVGSFYWCCVVVSKFLWRFHVFYDILSVDDNIFTLCVVWIFQILNGEISMDTMHAWTNFGSLFWSAVEWCIGLHATHTTKEKWYTQSVIAQSQYKQMKCHKTKP